MLWAILIKIWMKHLTEEQLYAHLTVISQVNQDESDIPATPGEIFVPLDSLLPAFSKIWTQGKSGCFLITCFSLHSSRGAKLLKSFSLLWVLNLVVFSTAYFIVPWSLQSSFKIPKWTLLHPITLLFSIFQQLLDPFIYPCFNIY